MKIKLIIWVFIFIIGLWNVGCENEFDPTEQGTQNIMAFGILDTRLDAQQFLIQNLAYKNTTNIPNDYEFYLYQGDYLKYKLKDANIADEKYRHFSLPGFKISRGWNYKIKVIKDSLIEQWASVDVPSESIIYGSFSGMNLETQNPSFNGSLFFYFDFAEKADQNSFYFDLKTIIEYDIIENGKTFTRQREIPYKISLKRKEEEKDFHFIQFKEDAFYDMQSISFGQNKGVFVNPGTFSSGGNPPVMIKKVVYPEMAIFYAFNFLKGQQPASNVTIKKIFSVCNTCSKELYEKILTKSGSQISSYRMDQAEYYSNMVKIDGDGVGFLGAYTSDTLKCIVPLGFIQSFGYKDGQN